MALVKITESLIRELRGSVHRMRDREVESKLPNLNNRYKLPQATELIERAEWLVHYDTLRHKIPNDWMENRARDSIGLGSFTEDGSFDGMGYIEFEDLENHFKRPTASAWERISAKVTIEWLESHRHLIGATEAIARYHDLIARNEIHKRWEGVFEQLQSLLQRCKSVNEAVKLVPNLRAYLGSDVIERLDRKVERATRESTVLEGINVDAINVAGIAAKLQGHF